MNKVLPSLTNSRPPLERFEQGGFCDDYVDFAIRFAAARYVIDGSSER
jgi:hypothetical protein